MNIIQKDITAITDGIIVQQVNCQGVMGAGLAKQLRSKYPVVYDSYKHLCSINKPESLLGIHQIIAVGPDTNVCNIFAQLNYGRGQLQTNYDAFRFAIGQLKIKINQSAYDGDVYFPEGIGCGLAGGDWNIVSGIINEVFPNAIICRHK